jgi:hypothetical protein
MTMVGQWHMATFDTRIDAYVDWLNGPGGLYPPSLQEGKRKSILVRLAPGKTLKALRGAFFSRRIKEPEFHFEVPDFLPDFCESVLSRDEMLQHFTATVSDIFLTALQENESLRECVDRIVVAQTLPDDALCVRASAAVYSDDDMQTIARTANRPKEYKQGHGTVVMGIIDEGIAFANERFRRSVDNSRVEYAWIQDGRCVGYVKGFGYGRELRKQDHRGRNGSVLVKGIDTLLRDCTSAGQVNEELFYCRAGLVDFGRTGHKAAAQRAAHGTHVMDLTCGYEQGSSPVGNDGMDQRPIVCVQLPTLTVADTSGLGLERYMLDGVNYILDRAGRIARSRGCGPLPVVINFSSGVLAGPHDGTHPIELAIDEIIGRRRKIAPTEVVLPAGNSYLSRLHAKISLPPKRGGNGSEASLGWRVLPDDKTCTYVEIWLPHPHEESNEIGIELMIEPPGGEQSPPLSDARSKRAVVWRPNGRDEICKVYYEFFGPPTNKGRYLVALLPTAFNRAPTQLAPCGAWTILMRNKTNQMVKDVNAWIQWDDRPLGYPRSGRQSYFADADYERFDKISGRQVEEDNEASLVRRAGTINAIATGRHAVVIGGFWHKECKVSNYSGAGPVTADYGAGACNRAGPDALAVTDDSSVRQGILAAGTRSGSVVAMNGTSVAAPQIAREIAERLARGDARTGRDIVEETADQQETSRPQSLRPTKERGGWGRIDVPPRSNRIGGIRIVGR